MKGFFIGYTNYSRKYKVYVPERDMVYERESVYADEGARVVPRGGEVIPAVPAVKDDTAVVVPTLPAPALGPQAGHAPSPVPSAAAHAAPVAAAPPATPPSSPAASLPPASPPVERPRDGLMDLFSSTRAGHGTARTWHIASTSYALMNVVNTFYGFDHEISLPHLFVLAEQVPLPKNIEEALHPDNPHREHWRGALKQEVSCFVKNNVIGACVKIAEVKAKGHKIVSTKSVFKVKPTLDGSVGRFRLRIVAKGCQTIPGLHYDQVYAPTARGSTVRLVLSIAATLSLRLTNLDVETAFLTADLPRDKPIFIYRPDGFEDLVADDECCLLNKSLYGLCNSPRLFNREFTQHLISLGFRKCVLDACLFVRDRSTAPTSLSWH